MFKDHLPSLGVFEDLAIIHFFKSSEKEITRYLSWKFPEYSRKTCTPPQTIIICTSYLSLLKPQHR